MNPAYADRAWQGTVVIAENVEIARDTYRVRLECPRDRRGGAARAVRHAASARLERPAAGPALAVYDVLCDAEGKPAARRHRVLRWSGKMTGRLARLRAGVALGGLGAAGQRLSGAADRAPGDGRRRHRPDAVPDARPRVPRAANLRRPAAAARPGGKGHALLRRPNEGLSGRRRGFPPPAASRSVWPRTTARWATTAW